MPYGDPKDDKWEVRGHRGGGPYSHDYRQCSYCGSMHPEDLFAAISDGAELGPTDKNYKVYVTVPNSIVGQIVECGSHSGPVFARDGRPSHWWQRFTAPTNLPPKGGFTLAERLRGRFKRVLYDAAPATIHAKFYFQHLDEDQMAMFIKLLNDGALNVGYPGHFYRLPFFCAPASRNA